MFDLVIFDLDGVIVDSEVISCEVLIAALARHGVAIDAAYVYRHYIGRSYEVMAGDVATRHGGVLPADFEQEFRDALLTRFDAGLNQVAGVGTVLADLNVPFCIATSSSAARAGRSIAAAGLAQSSIPVFTAGMVARGKPSPDLFLHAAAALRHRPERCLVVEDSTAGIEAAKAAGMTAWRFTGGSHFPLGYGDVPLTVGADRDFAAMADFFDSAPALRRP
jgi:HAD superfamily hydrolase (TIGR01509 family)